MALFQLKRLLLQFDSKVKNIVIKSSKSYKIIVLEVYGSTYSVLWYQFLTHPLDNLNLLKSFEDLTSVLKKFKFHSFVKFPETYFKGSEMIY